MNTDKPYHLDNIIIDFGVSSSSVQALTQRLAAKNQNYTVIKVDGNLIDQDPTLYQQELFKHVDPNTRIYLYAHGGLSRETKIVGHQNPETHQNEIEYDYHKVSDYLAKRLDKSQVNDDTRNLKISIIACHAGFRTKVEGQDKEYFATHLHRELAERHDLVVDVVARNSLTVLLKDAAENTGKKVVRRPDERTIETKLNAMDKNFQKWFDLHRSKLGTKSNLTWNKNGEQIVVDASLSKLANLNELHKELLRFRASVNPALKGKFQELLDNFPLIDIRKLEKLTKEDIIQISKKVQSMQRKLEEFPEFQSKYLNKVKKISQQFTENESAAELKDQFADQLDIFKERLRKQLRLQPNADLDRKLKEAFQNYSRSKKEGANIKELIFTIWNVSNEHNIFQAHSDFERLFTELSNTGIKIIGNWQPLQGEVLKGRINLRQNQELI